MVVVGAAVVVVGAAVVVVVGAAVVVVLSVREFSPELHERQNNETARRMHMFCIHKLAADF